MKERIAIYVRVSTSTSKAKGKGSDARVQDTEMQKREILAHIASRGLQDFEIYEDKGYSGTKDARPALKRLMADCRAGKVRTVICWKLDRLFRSLRHLINTLDEFSRLGLEFVALRDSIDLSTHSGRLMMQLLGAFAEFESSVTRERVNAGLDNARAKGKRLGRRPKPIPEAEMQELLARGATHVELSRALGVSTKTIQRALKRRG